MNGNGTRPVAGPAATVYPASHRLGQAHLLLRAAYAIQVGTYLRGRPRQLDQAQRGRLAALFAAITSWVRAPGPAPGVLVLHRRRLRLTTQKWTSRRRRASEGFTPPAASGLCANRAR